MASAILEKEPALITSVKPLTPPALDHVIRRCLAKDPEERWQTARDFALELKWITESGSQSMPAPVLRRTRTRDLIAAGGAGGGWNGTTRASGTGGSVKWTPELGPGIGEVKV